MNEDDPSSFLIKRTKKYSFDEPNTVLHINSGLSEESAFSKSEEENLVNAFFRPVKHGSVSSSVFCMICVTLGTGMLPIPHLFTSNGLILTFIFFLIFSFPTYKTLQILIKISRKNKIYNFPELVSKYFGVDSFMTKLTIISLLINSFGCIILWNFYINKFSIGLIAYFKEEYATNLNGNYICIMILIFIQIPLAIYNKGNEFDIMSTIGVLQILYVLIVLIIEFPSYLKEFFDKSIFTTTKTYFNFNIFKIMEIPFVLFTSFGNHSTILSVVQEIDKKTEQRVLKVGTYTFFGEFYIYIYLVLICFFSTYSHTYDNEIFLIRPKITFLMTLGQFFMVILMICNISLYYFTTLPTLQYMFNKNREFNNKQNIVAANLMLLILTFISFFLSDLDKILTFLGIFAQVSLLFIIPMNLYLKTKENRIKQRKKILIYIGIYFYSLLGIVGFFFMIFNKSKANN